MGRRADPDEPGALPPRGGARGDRGHRERRPRPHAGGARRPAAPDRLPGPRRAGAPERALRHRRRRRRPRRQARAPTPPRLRRRRGRHPRRGGRQLGDHQVAGEAAPHPPGRGRAGVAAGAGPGREVRRAPRQGRPRRPARRGRGGRTASAPGCSSSCGLPGPTASTPRRRCARRCAASHRQRAPTPTGSPDCPVECPLLDDRPDGNRAMRPSGTGRPHSSAHFDGDPARRHTGCGWVVSRPRGCAARRGWSWP